MIARPNIPTRKLVAAAAGAAICAAGARGRRFVHPCRAILPDRYAGRSRAENPKVIEHPFEKGVAAGVSATVPTEIFGLSGFHTFRAAYSDARGMDLDDIGAIRPLVASVVTKKGYWFGSYAIQQNLFQSETNPAVGWGLFGLAAQSDGNPTPVKWNMLVGLAAYVPRK